MTTTDEPQITEPSELATFRHKARSFLAEHAPKRGGRRDDEEAADRRSSVVRFSSRSVRTRSVTRLR